MLTYGLPLSSVLGQACSDNAGTCGQWSGVVTWPIEAVHAHMLHTGKVLVWSWPPNSTTNLTKPQLWDPDTNAFPPTTTVPARILCSGHAFLADGTLFVAGGHKSSYNGLVTAEIYQPNGDSWTTGLRVMNAGRWYPTTTTLASGDALVISGQTNGQSWNDQNGTYDKIPQVFQVASGTWRTLSNIPLGLPYYPYMFVAPNGNVFLAGPVRQTRYLIIPTSGSASWKPVPPSPSPGSIYGERNWGSAVMYAPGQILIMGGTQCGWYADTCTSNPSVPTATAETINLNDSSPVWKSTGSMAERRKLHNATLLPNGNVFVSGGSTGIYGPLSANENQDPALPCEVWNPNTGLWSLRSSLSTYRGYHSVALLLPDGRVLSAGGEHPTYPNKKTSAEIYSPEYLFDSNGNRISDSSRPSISSAPTSVIYGSMFTVNTPDGASITKVTMLGLGSVTHGFNMGQRFVNLSPISQVSGGLSVHAPANSNLAPPGYYMLFILKGTVPSVARFIQLH